MLGYVGKSPGVQRAEKGFQKIFKILRRFENVFWRGASVDVGIFIAYFWRQKCRRAQRDMNTVPVDVRVTLRGLGSCDILRMMLARYWLL